MQPQLLLHWYCWWWMLMQQFPPTAFLKPVDSEPTRDELNNPNSISHGFIRGGDPTIQRKLQWRWYTACLTHKEFWEMNNLISREKSCTCESHFLACHVFWTVKLSDKGSDVQVRFLKGNFECKLAAQALLHPAQKWMMFLCNKSWVKVLQAFSFLILSF